MATEHKSEYIEERLNSLNLEAKISLLGKILEAVDIDQYGKIELKDVEGFGSWWTAQEYALDHICTFPERDRPK